MTNKRRRLIGVVTKNSSAKTVSVKVTRTTVHPLYRKVLRVSDNYLAHDAQEKANVGDEVIIVESRPISKLKRWSLEDVVKSGTLSEDSVPENTEN
tara:strand:- start:875 stop:1162 length:288 start_codon:yes stop_codon:yes gene_type:complete